MGRPSALPVLAIAALALCANTSPLRAAETSYAVTDLGSLQGFDTVATGINASGQVTGYSYAFSGFPHAFLWSDGVMTDLGTPAGSDYSVATGINASGQVVGYSVIPQIRALLFDAGTITDLGTLGGTEAIAQAINDQGEVVGWSNPANSGGFHAFHYGGGTMTDLGAFD